MPHPVLSFGNASINKYLEASFGYLMFGLHASQFKTRLLFAATEKHFCSEHYLHD